MKIYLASSWRNKAVGEIVRALRGEGHSVYDFREDDEDGAAFNWSDIDVNWQKWTPEEFKEKLWHPRADAGFNRDFSALKAAEAVVLVMPCGRSAHLELGYAVGAGKRTAILLSDGEPELCYRMVDVTATSLGRILEWAGCVEDESKRFFKTKASPVTKKGPE